MRQKGKKTSKDAISSTVAWWGGWWWGECLSQSLLEAVFQVVHMSPQWVGKG